MSSGSNSRAYDPTYKPTKDWEQIAKQLPNNQYAQDQAANLRKHRAQKKASPGSSTGEAKPGR